MSLYKELTQEEVRKIVVQLQADLSQIEGRRVVILGDVGLDEYLMGDVRRISPEAPVPVVEVAEEDNRAGLSANVAQNVAALGATASLLGAVGQDEGAKTLSQLLLAQGVKDFHWVQDPGRPTTRKVRVMSGQHHLVRVDFEKKSFLSASSESELLKKLGVALKNADVLVLQDYGKGVLSEGLCQKSIALAREASIPILVDPHRTTPIQYYRGADLIKPNRDEAYVLSGLNLDELRMGPDTIMEVGQALLQKAEAKSLAITQGAAGVMIFEAGEVKLIPTVSRQVYDVTGAGDTFLAVFSLAMAAGVPLSHAAVLANAASGVVVGKVGCHPCLPEELKMALETYSL